MVSCPLLRVTCGGVGGVCSSVDDGAGTCSGGGSGAVFLWCGCASCCGTAFAGTDGFGGALCVADSYAGRQSPAATNNANPNSRLRPTIKLYGHAPV